MVLPRMLALSEVVWSPAGRKNWDDFNQRLQAHFRMFDQKGLHYSKGNFKVDILPTSSNGKLQVKLSTEAYKGEVHYTMNGETPTASSPRYSAPIPVNATMTVKAVAVVNGKAAPGPAAEQRFILHKGTGRNVTYTNPISNAYKADGPNSLTDGVRGTLMVGKYWHGISGKDLIATIDLGTATEIQKISIGCLQHYRDWIFMPAGVNFEVSADGVNFQAVGTAANTVDVNDRQGQIKDFSVNFGPRQARFVRVHAKVLESCPKGHPGEGKPAWIFADEIVVE
jgi:hexosaminidase